MLPVNPLWLTIDTMAEESIFTPLVHTSLLAVHKSQYT